MNVKKPVLIAGAVATMGLAGVTGLGVVNAATTTSGTPTNSSLVSKIASKFGLKQSDVQAVFDQDKSDHQAQRQADEDKRLTALVTSGKITAAQKTLIENKQTQLQSARETEMTALKSWATSNNIDPKYLMGGPGGSDRLQSLVDDGTITSAQMTLIQNKQAELKTAREAAKTALDKWAGDNGIDTQYLMGFDGPGGGHGFRGPGGPGGSDDSSSDN